MNTGLTMIKGVSNNRAWLAVVPVVLVVAFSAVVPLMTVVNYSVQDIFDVDTRLFVGLDWYRETLRDPRFIDALLRQVTFSATVLVIEVPCQTRASVICCPRHVDRCR